MDYMIIQEKIKEVKMGEEGEKTGRGKLPVNQQGNLMTATGDENLKDIFHTIRMTNTPVSLSFLYKVLFFGKKQAFLLIDNDELKLFR